MNSTTVAGLALAIISMFSATAVTAQQAPAVPVERAAKRDLRESLALTGRVVSLQKVDLRARVSGFLEKTRFAEGKSVKAGDVLYEIENGTYKAAVDEIDGSIGAAEAGLRLAQIEAARQKTLGASRATSQRAVETADANVEKLSSEIVGLKARRATAALQLSYTEIVAPFDGIVGLSAVDDGALVMPETGPLVTLTRLDPISVEFPVATSQYLSYSERIRKGEIDGKANVSVRQSGGNIYPLKGDIDFVSSNVNRGTDTIILRANFANPDQVLLDGELVKVILEQSAPEEVLAIPRQSVLRDQAGAFVMVVDADSKVELRRVSIARVTEASAVIDDGVKEGELVVTDGFAKLRPGIVVNPTLGE